MGMHFNKFYELLGAGRTHAVHSEVSHPAPAPDRVVNGGLHLKHCILLWRRRQRFLHDRSLASRAAQLRRRRDVRRLHLLLLLEREQQPALKRVQCSMLALQVESLALPTLEVHVSN